MAILYIAYIHKLSVILYLVLKHSTIELGSGRVILKYLLVIVIGFLISCVGVNQNINYKNITPKYGIEPKNPKELMADSIFIATALKESTNEEASNKCSDLGWKYFKSGDAITAMKRFNQSWLLQNDNYDAIWGMGVVEGYWGRLYSSEKLLKEATKLSGSNELIELDLAVAYASLSLAREVKWEKESYLKQSDEIFKKYLSKENPSQKSICLFSIILLKTERKTEACDLIKRCENDSDNVGSQCKSTE